MLSVLLAAVFSKVARGRSHLHGAAPGESVGLQRNRSSMLRRFLAGRQFLSALKHSIEEF
jgi:hypothetical protein